MSDSSFLANAASRIVSGILSAIMQKIATVALFTWDFGLTFYNFVAPVHPTGKVIAQGLPGHQGRWPEYRPPTATDSRSCCPALNAMANHGILPRDGRNIKYTDLTEKIRTTYNFAPSFCYMVPNVYAKMLSRSYAHDTIDLSDFNVHNNIEHDASLTRHDTALQPDQSKPALDLVDGLLACATGPDGQLTPADLAAYSTRRRREAKATNPQFSLATSHKIFGSSNSATLLAIMGGKVKHLEPFLKEERIPEGWEPAVRNPGGLTIAAFNLTTFRIELGIDEGPVDKKTQ